MSRRSRDRTTSPDEEDLENLEEDSASASVPAPPGAIRVQRREPTPLYAWLSRLLLRAETWVRSHGSWRIRGATRLLWALVAAAGVFLLFGPVINKPLAWDDVTASTGTVLETWVARSFDAEVTLHRDDDGRSRTDITETITAFFPDGADESSLSRIVSNEFEGHDLRPVLRAASLDGVAVEADVDHRVTQTTFTVEAGERLRGEHTVVLEYTLHDAVFEEFDESTRRQEQVLAWNVFGPDWTHGSMAARASITVPVDVDESRSRAPDAGISWLLLADSTTLEPDSTTADTVTYVAENDQNMPPHSNFWFRFRFEPGTFALPPPSALYIVQLVGPFVPLLLLAVGLLFALAARAVAWGDARGRAWFVHQTEPEDGVPPGLAARIWRAVRTSALVDAVETYRSTPRDPRARLGLVRAAHRTGTLGDLPAAWTRYFTAPAWGEQFRRRLRRVPRGFVRDSFLGAAIALTLVQWGLVRQLSHQLALSVYWWPVAIVLVSTALAVVIVVIALSARPLTRRGAFVREHLLGLELFIRQTSGAERTSLRDSLLPYAVMFSPPRRAGALVTRLAGEAGLVAEAKEARSDPAYVSGARVAVRVASVLMVIAAIVFSIVSPLERPGTDRQDAAYGWQDVPGDYGVFVHDFAADGMLVLEDGRPRLEVEERLSVRVDENRSNVPQVMRQWVDRVDGHDMRLTVTAVEVDGEPVAFRQTRAQGMAMLVTEQADEWPGEHDVVIGYSLASPFGRVQADAGWRDQLRWTALNRGWDSGWRGVDDDVSRVAVGFELPASLAEEAVSAAWLAESYPRDVLRPLSEGEDSGGVVAYEDVITPDEDGRWSSLPFYDRGVVLQLPVGAATQSGEAGFLWHGFVQALPITVPLVLAAITVPLGILSVLLALLRPQRLRGGVLRDLARWAVTGLALAQVVLLFSASINLAADDARLGWLAITTAVSVGSAIASLMLTRRRRIPLDTRDA